MATRSRIALVQQDGTVHSIYCHWDGYPDYNGRILLDHYQDRAKIEQLMALGNISTLGSEIGEKHDFEFKRKMAANFRFENNTTDWASLEQDPEYVRLNAMCNAYGRDRGNNPKLVERKIDSDLHQLASDFAESDEEFLYVYGHPSCAGWCVVPRSNPTLFIEVPKAIEDLFEVEGVAV